MLPLKHKKLYILKLWIKSFAQLVSDFDTIVCYQTMCTVQHNIVLKNMILVQSPRYKVINIKTSTSSLPTHCLHNIYIFFLMTQTNPGCAGGKLVCQTCTPFLCIYRNNLQGPLCFQVISLVLCASQVGSLQGETNYLFLDSTWIARFGMTEDRMLR